MGPSARARANLERNSWQRFLREEESKGTIKKSAVPELPKAFVNLVKEHGVALVVYYFVFNEACIIALTFLLHNGLVAGSDLVGWLKWIKVDRFFNVEETLGRTVSFGPFSISAALVTNYTLASAFMSLCTPVQIPFCVMTLRMVKSVVFR